MLKILPIASICALSIFIIYNGYPKEYGSRPFRTNIYCNNIGMCLLSILEHEILNP